MCEWVKEIAAVASMEKQATPSSEQFEPSTSDTEPGCWHLFCGIFQGNTAKARTCLSEKPLLVLCTSKVRGNSGLFLFSLVQAEIGSVFSCSRVGLKGT